MKNNKYYQIRNIETGLYSNGKSPEPRFNDKGKIWKNLSAVKSHITLITKLNMKFNKNAKSEHPHPYLDCEIVELELVEKQSYSSIESIMGSYERIRNKCKR